MRLKWGKSESKYFNKKIVTAEKDYDWVFWLILGLCSLAGLAYLFLEVIK